MTVYEEIVSKLEAAGCPSRELDRAILRYVSARIVRDETFIHGQKDGTREIKRAYPLSIFCRFAPRYTQSLAAAISLVPRSCTYALGDSNPDDLPWACVTTCTGEDFAATAPTTELAVCLAAVKAHEARITA